MNRRENDGHDSRGEFEFLTSQDKANGFSVQLSDSRNASLLKGGKTVAWFSAAVLPETVRAMVRLIASREQTSRTAKNEGELRDC